MLVLSRKVGQRIMIGDNITILISRVSGKRVTLGFEAPRDVSIRRAELPSVDKIENAQDSAAESDKEPDGEEPLDEELPGNGRMLVSLAPHPFAPR